MTMTNDATAAERVRRINAGETYRGVYGTDSIGYLERDRITLADAYLSFTDPTPVDEAWLRSIGFTDDPDRVWLQLITPLDIEITWWRSDGEISLSNSQNGLELEHRTRGQLAMLLNALGIKGAT